MAAIGFALLWRRARIIRSACGRRPHLAARMRRRRWLDSRSAPRPTWSIAAESAYGETTISQSMKNPGSAWDGGFRVGRCLRLADASLPRARRLWNHARARLELAAKTTSGHAQSGAAAGEAAPGGLLIDAVRKAYARPPAAYLAMAAARAADRHSPPISSVCVAQAASEEPGGADAMKREKMNKREWTLVISAGVDGVPWRCTRRGSLDRGGREVARKSPRCRRLHARLRSDSLATRRSWRQGPVVACEADGRLRQ